MGQIVHALIEHRLIPEDILLLPAQLGSAPDDAIAGQWRWVMPNMDKQALTDYWDRKPEYFINNLWGKQDLALLEKESLTLHFSMPHLVSFDSSLRWDTYSRNGQFREEFNRLTEVILSLLNAVDILFVPDLSSVDFFGDNGDLTVDSYRQKVKGNKLYAIELE